MSTDKKELVIFIGLKGTGKDYNAQLFINKGFKKIALADPLRSMLWQILGFLPCKETGLTYEEFKKSIFTTDVIHKWSLFPKSIIISTGRKMLQNLGSVVKKMFGETVWADLWYKSVLENECNTVCTDARFPYELNTALKLTRKGYNVTFVWVCYKNANFKEILKDKHESEALAQFIYYNQDKYNLKDSTTIKHNVLKQILQDFNNTL